MLGYAARMIGHFTRASAEQALSASLKVGRAHRNNASRSRLRDVCPHALQQLLDVVRQLFADDIGGSLPYTCTERLGNGRISLGTWLAGHANLTCSKVLSVAAKLALVFRSLKMEEI